MRKIHALDQIHSSGLTFGKVPLRSMIGSRGRCRESQPWDWQPTTLRENDLFRMEREPHGKHITMFPAKATFESERDKAMRIKIANHKWRPLPDLRQYKLVA